MGHVYLRLRLRTFPCPSSSMLCTLVLPIFPIFFAAFALFEEVVDVVVEEDEVVVEVVVVVPSLHSSSRSKSGGERTTVSMAWTTPVLHKNVSVVEISVQINIEKRYRCKLSTNHYPPLHQ